MLLIPFFQSQLPTPDILVGIAAAVLAVLFDLPGIKSLWDKLAPAAKQVVMALILLIVTGEELLRYCSGADTLTCAKANGLQFLLLYVTALAINQGVHFGTRLMLGQLSAPKVK